MARHGNFIHSGGLTNFGPGDRSTWQPLRLQVDIAFSYYDGSRRVPWGSTDEVAFTKNLDCKRILLSFCRGLLNKWILKLSWNMLGPCGKSAYAFNTISACHVMPFWRLLRQVQFGFSFQPAQGKATCVCKGVY